MEEFDTTAYTPSSVLLSPYRVHVAEEEEDTIMIAEQFPIRVQQHCLKMRQNSGTLSPQYRNSSIPRTPLATSVIKKVEILGSDLQVFPIAKLISDTDQAHSSTSGFSSECIGGIDSSSYASAADISAAIVTHSGLSKARKPDNPSCSLCNLRKDSLPRLPTVHGSAPSVGSSMSVMATATTPQRYYSSYVSHSESYATDAACVNELHAQTAHFAGAVGEHILYNNERMKTIRNGNSDAWNAKKRAGSFREGTPEQIDFLHLALVDANIAMLERFCLMWGDINITDRSGTSALSLVLTCPLRQSSSAAIGYLLQHGADANLPNDEGSTPLMYAARITDPLVTRLLISFGASLGCVDCFGTTPLMCAAMNKNLAVLNVMLAHDTMVVNAKDSVGRTALHWAVAVQSVDCVKALMAVEHVDVCLTDRLQDTALHLCARVGNCSLGRTLLQKLRASKLKELLDTESPSDGTAAAIAEERGHIEFALMLENQRTEANTRLSYSTSAVLARKVRAPSPSVAPMPRSSSNTTGARGSLWADSCGRPIKRIRRSTAASISTDASDGSGLSIKRQTANGISVPEDVILPEGSDPSQVFEGTSMAPTPFDSVRECDPESPGALDESDVAAQAKLRRRDYMRQHRKQKHNALKQMQAMVGHVESEHGILQAEVARLRDEAAALRKLFVQAADAYGGQCDGHTDLPLSETHTPVQRACSNGSAREGHTVPTGTLFSSPKREVSDAAGGVAVGVSHPSPMTRHSGSSIFNNLNDLSFEFVDTTAGDAYNYHWQYGME